MSETKTDMMLNGICMVCENKDTLCTHIGQVKGECPFIQKAISTKITNADKIRSMTDEELAEFLDDLTDNCCRCAEHQNCGNCQIGLDVKTGFCDIKNWLQSEAE